MHKLKKSINECPARLQRIRLKLQRYNITVKYKPGKSLLLAVALSRSFIEDTNINLEKEIQEQVCLIKESLPISFENIKKIYNYSDKQLKL